MPTCKLCECIFSNILRSSDGRILNLNKRKYCLTCSPFKGRNTRKLTPDRLYVAPSSERPSEPRECFDCQRIFNYRRGIGASLNRCSPCTSLKRAHEVKDRLINEKGGKCERCGFNRLREALSFHHRDPSTKLFQLAHNLNRRWEIVKAEADKCDLLCAHCHIEIHVIARKRGNSS